MSRKTIDIQTIKEMVNDFLLNSPDDDKPSRETMIMFFENVCKKTMNEPDFYYLSKEAMRKSESGTSFGIAFTPDGKYNFNNTDHTRVQF